MKEKNNYSSKPITEFTQDQTLYMQRKKDGFNYNLHLQFVSYSKGIVTGIILDIQPNSNKSIWFGKELYKIGSKISTSISKCYTYDNRCHWFEKGNNGWVCK